jgi:hypothetical protein
MRVVAVFHNLRHTGCTQMRHNELKVDEFITIIIRDEVSK